MVTKVKLKIESGLVWFYGISTIVGLFNTKIHFYTYKVKLASLVEGDPKASFSITTTPRCRGGRYYFSWIAPLYP